MPSDTRLNTPFAPALDLPPAFRLVTLARGRRRLRARAGERRRARRRHAGVCRPLRSRRVRRGAGARRAAPHRAARLLRRHGGADRRAAGARAAREAHRVASWPDAIYRRSRPGRRRRSFAWPDGTGERTAGLAGVRRHDPHRLDGRWRAGLASALHGARGRGLRRGWRGRAGRQLRPPSDGADRCLARIRVWGHRQDLSFAARAGEVGVRRDIDDNGDLLVRRVGPARRRAALADARRWPSRPGSIPRRGDRR